MVTIDTGCTPLNAVKGNVPTVVHIVKIGLLFIPKVVPAIRLQKTGCKSVQKPSGQEVLVCWHL